MELWGLRHAVAIVAACLLLTCRGTEGIRFWLEKEECFSHDVKYEGDIVHVSFVVIKRDSRWPQTFGGLDVDLVVCYIIFFFFIVCVLLINLVLLDCFLPSLMSYR
jgi:hypothetical protein